MAIQFKRCTESQRQVSSVVLAEGQPLYTTDKHKLFIGDGVTEAKDLVGTGAGLNIENGVGKHSIVQVPKEYGVEDDDTLTYGNDASGADSIALGISSKATWKRAVAIGNGCESHGNTSFTIGQVNITGSHTENEDGTSSSTGNGSFTGGNGNNNQGNYSVVFGQNNNMKKGGQNSIIVGFLNEMTNVNDLSQQGNGLIGLRLKSSWSNQFICGHANVDIGPDGNGDYPYFIVGNGTSIDNRSNAFEIYKSGKTKIYNNVDVSGSLILGNNEPFRTTIYPEYLNGSKNLYISHNGDDICNIRAPKSNLIINDGSLTAKSMTISNNITATSGALTSPYLLRTTSCLNVTSANKGQHVPRLEDFQQSRSSSLKFDASMNSLKVWKTPQDDADTVRAEDLRHSYISFGTTLDCRSYQPVEQADIDIVEEFMIPSDLTANLSIKEIKLFEYNHEPNFKVTLTSSRMGVEYEEVVGPTAVVDDFVEEPMGKQIISTLTHTSGFCYYYDGYKFKTVDPLTITETLWKGISFTGIVTYEYKYQNGGYNVYELRIQGRMTKYEEDKVRSYDITLEKDSLDMEGNQVYIGSKSTYKEESYSNNEYVNCTISNPVPLFCI